MSDHMADATPSDIETLRRQVESGTDDARYAAWLALYAGDTAERRAEWERVVGGDDPILKMLCARFLADRTEARAAAVLVRFLLDANVPLQRAAGRAFARHRYEAKYDYLLPVLTQGDAMARRFAAAQLSFSGNAAYVDPLIACCADAEWPNVSAARSASTGSAEGVNEWLCDLLIALRRFPEARVVRAVRRYGAHARVTVRRAAVLALGVLCGGAAPGARRALWRAAGDAEPAIRRLVAWGLRQRPRRWDLPRIRRWLSRERSPEVIEELFRALSAFPSAANLVRIVRTAAMSGDRTLRLRGEATVLAAPAWAAAWAVDLLRRDPEARIRQQAVRLAAVTLRDQPHCFPLLERHLADRRFRDDELTTIEALGVLGDSRAVPLLEARLARTPLLSYAALAAILQVLRHRPPEALLPYLRHDRLSPLHRQMVLRGVLRHLATGSVTEEVRAAVRPYLQHENLNLRYLSGEILAQSRDRASLSALIAMVGAEVDPGLRAYLLRGLQRWLPHDAAAIHAVRRLSHAGVEAILFAALDDPHVPASAVQAQVSVLCAALAGETPLYRACGVAYLVTQLQRQTIGLMDVLDGLAQHPDRSTWLHALAQAAAVREVAVAVPVAQWRQQWTSATPTERALRIEWLALAREREAIIPLAQALAMADDHDAGALVTALHRTLHRGALDTSNVGTAS